MSICSAPADGDQSSTEMLSCRIVVLLGFVKVVPARAPDHSAANLRFNVTSVKTRLRAWIDPLAKVNVESLKEFEYFTFVRIGKGEKALPLKEPVDYWVDYDKTLLTLHFTLPLETRLEPTAEEVAVDVYDPSFFVAFGFAADAPGTSRGQRLAAPQKLRSLIPRPRRTPRR